MGIAAFATPVGPLGVGAIVIMECPVTEPSTEQKQQQQEAERAALEAKMTEIRTRVDAMRSGTAAETGPAHVWVKEQCVEPKLAMEFKRQMLDQARAHDCDASMRATDAALADAARLAVEERMVERAAKLSEARTLHSKACQLGANEHFRRATGRLIETIMMTGGVRKSGPTRAKPLDTAPKPPQLAKAS